MAEASVRGKFVWHELLTPDPKAAAAFYGKIVGWKPQSWDKDPSYTLLTMGGRPMAGAMVLPEAAKAMGAPPHWESYIGTPDVDATARQAAELGGRILRPAADIPDIGRFAILQDPQGAVFAAFTPKQAPAADAKPGLGDFFWHDLATTNYEAAFSFYQKLFGWEKTSAIDMGPNGTYQMFGLGGDTVGGMFNKSPSMPGHPAWLPYVIIPDVKRAAEVVKQLGGTVMHGPAEVSGGDWVVQGMDPQGAMFAVHSRKPAALKAKPIEKPTPAAKSKPAKKKSKAVKKSKPAAKPRPAKKKAKPAKKKKAQKKTKKGGKKR